MISDRPGVLLMAGTRRELPSWYTMGKPDSHRRIGRHPTGAKTDSDNHMLFSPTLGGAAAPPSPINRISGIANPLRQALTAATARDLNAENLTDLGNAKRFVRTFRAELRWIPQWNRWLQWSGTHWADISDDEVRRLAQKVVERMATDAEQEANATRRTKLRTHANKAEASKNIQAMIKEAKPLLVGSADDFDRHSHLYNVENGTLDLSATRIEDVFRPHCREDYITKVVEGVSWYRDAVCPRFDRFLREIFAGDEETALFVLKTMATCLVGDLVEQAYYLWFGQKGRNGKGALQRILNRLAEPYRVTIDPRLFFASFKYDPNAPSSAVMSLRSARLVIGSEMSKDDVIGGAFLKRYTGGDDISGRDLHEKQRDTKTFRPTGTAIVSTNFFPQADPTDDALWARTRIVEFPVTFGAEGGPPIDATLEDDLQQELPGILVRLVEAWMLIQQADRKKVSVKRGLLEAPDRVLQTTQMVRSTFGPIGLFIHEMCVTGPEEREQPRKLYEAYLRWAQEHDKDPDETLTETGFGTQLNLLKYDKRTSNSKTYRKGLRLKTDVELGLVPPTYEQMKIDQVQHQ